MGHVDVGVTHNVYGKGRCREEAQAVWLMPHFFAIRRKVFRASGGGARISVDQKARSGRLRLPRWLVTGKSLRSRSRGCTDWRANGMDPPV